MAQISKVGGKRKKTGGRKKGTPNKMTAAAQTAIETAAQAIGGADRLTAWIKEDPANEKAFWTQVYPKLLPLQVNGNIGFNVTIPPATRSL